MYAQKPLNKIKTRDISDRFWIGSFWKWAFYLMPKDISRNYTLWIIFRDYVAPG